MAVVNGYHFSARHLSAQETVCDLLHQHGASTLIHAAILKSEISITTSNFQLALRKLVEFQPALRMRVASETGVDTRLKCKKVTKRFQEMEPAEIDFSMRLADSQEAWISIAEEELAIPFDSNRGPLWKVIYVEFTGSAQHSMPPGDIYATLPGDTSVYADSTYMRYASSAASTVTSSSHMNGHSSTINKQSGVLLFKIHHVIADGVSMLSLIHEQLIPILNDIIVSGSAPSFSVQNHVMPSATESFPEAKLSRQLLKDINFERAASPKQSQVPINGTLPPPVPLFGVSQYFNPGDVGGSKLWCYKLPRLLSTGLKSACQTRQASVHDVLMVSASIALGVCAEQQKVELSGDHVICSHPIDLRQLHHTQTRVHSLGLWSGYNIAKVKSSSCKTFPSEEKFWKMVRKNAENRVHKPWSALSVYPELLNMIHRQESTRPAAEMFKSHFEIASYVREGEESTSQSHLNQPFHQQFNTVGSITQTQPVTWIEVDSHFIFKSVSDISNAPMSLMFVCYRGRTYCNVTYNPRWLTEDFVKAFILQHSQLLTNMCLTRGPSAKRRHVRDKYLPPYLRSEGNLEM